MKKLLLVLVMLGAGAAFASWYAWGGPPAEVSYRTVTVKRGDVLATITATGTIEPEEVVDVGAQVAGRIDSLGNDPLSPEKSIDYGSLVEEGTVLAQIEDAVYDAQVEQARANVKRAEGELQQFQVKLDQTEREWKRAESLRDKKVLTESDYDLARANYEAAKAQMAISNAAVAQAWAMLRIAEINLQYATIKSPVNGVILDRRVNVGQTVVASLNAPSLFLIAKDLKRMQIWASVNEADIGQIRQGQNVKFSVDAFRGATFAGKVSQIRLNATMTQNVVTYTVVVTTDNSDGKLLPYLTASVRFEIDARENVLLVPNPALRWQPRSETAKTESTSGGAGRRKRSETAASGNADPTTGRLWIKNPDDGTLKAVSVKLGLSDGIVTQVEGEGLQEGAEVVIGENRADKGPAASPFAPKMFGGGGSRGAP